MSLALDEILGSPDSRQRIVIDFKTNVGVGRNSRPSQVVGFNNTGFSISTANQYNNPLESTYAEALTQTAQNIQGGLNSVLPGLSPDIKAPISLKTTLSTINAWVGSERPVFNVNFYIVAYKKNVNVLDKVRELYQVVYPSNGKVLKGIATITPPQGYLVNFGDAFDPSQSRVNGTVALGIGDWFLATNLNPLSMNFEYSPQIMENGSPLYVQVNATFTPYRMVTIEDVLGYLQR